MKRALIFTAFVALSGCGSRVPIVASPNESIAGLSLTRDAMEYIVSAERENAAAPSWMPSRSGTDVVAKRMSAEPDANGMWVEIWEVQRGGVRVAYSVTFTPGAAGVTKVAGKLLGDPAKASNLNVGSALDKNAATGATAHPRP